MRISNSFGDDEIAVMNALCRAEALRPRSVLARSKGFASLWRKAKQMGDKVRAASENAESKSDRHEEK